MRRIPSQERGIERVDRLLAAAASVIAEVGVEAMTTNAITVKAKTSVGSLYQFFPSKDAIIFALASRYHEELRTINDTVSKMNLAGLPLADIVDRVMTPFIHFFIAHPAYRHVYHAINRPEAPSGEEAELHHVIVKRVESMLEIYWSDSNSESRHLHATTIVVCAHSLLSYAITCDDTMRDAVIAELKNMLIGYISSSVKEFSI